MKLRKYSCFFILALIVLIYFAYNWNIERNKLDFDPVCYLDKTSVKPNETLTIHVENNGKKNIEFGVDYQLYAVHNDIFLELIPPWPFISIHQGLGPGGTWEGVIDTDLEPSMYVLRKKIQRGDKESKRFFIEFEVT